MHFQLSRYESSIELQYEMALQIKLSELRIEEIYLFISDVADLDPYQFTGSGSVPPGV
jgi:hypothetical protein